LVIDSEDITVDVGIKDLEDSGVFKILYVGESMKEKGRSIDSFIDKGSGDSTDVVIESFGEFFIKVVDFLTLEILGFSNFWNSAESGFRESIEEIGG
jgi:hypothetical protein